MKRFAQAVFFAALLGLVALAFPHQARAYTWSLVIVDAAGNVGEWTSIAVDANGDPMISYIDITNGDLKLAICDLSASTNGNCDQATDWSTVTVDDEVSYAESDVISTSVAVDANGDPIIAYHAQYSDLGFAICDISVSTNGNCDQTSDWSTVTVPVPEAAGFWTSIAVDANGDPIISHHMSLLIHDLRFSICDISASANGNCDQTADWTTVTVDDDLSALVGHCTSIAVDANGDPMISHCRPWPGHSLRFSICDISASANGNCDQTADWTTVTVDPDTGTFTSIAVDANGDPMISYRDELTNQDLKFAICDISASANGNCDQTTDWSTVIVDAPGDVGLWSSIAVDTNGDPTISYHDPGNLNLKFAICDISASTNGNCDQTIDWSTVTVDSTGDVGEYTSIAVGTDGHPMISYYDETNGDLKFATASPPSPPVGGLAELPDTAGSSGPNYGLLAGAIAAAVVALTAGAWCARRRSLG